MVLMELTFNRSNGSASGDYRAHVVSLIHWKA